MNPNKRINNKNEFHQPGDVEVHYEKNQNENMKKKKSVNQNVENLKNKKSQENEEVGVPKPTEPSIRDFLQNIRNNIENITENENPIENEENILSTQDMISDAIARKMQKVAMLHCDKCEFKSGSKTVVINHQKSIHNEDSNKCDKCEYEANTKGDLNKRNEESHKEID